MGSARFNPVIDGEMAGDLHGWPRSPAWLRFNNQNLANGIKGFAFHYAHGADPIPLIAEIRVAPAGTEIRGAEVFTLAQRVGRIETTATHTGGWHAPGNTVRTDEITYTGSGMMDIYVLFMPGGINFVDAAIDLDLD
jgi:hypothetical protein